MSYFIVVFHWRVSLACFIGVFHLLGASSRCRGSPRRFVSQSDTLLYHTGSIRHAISVSTSFISSFMSLFHFISLFVGANIACVKQCAAFTRYLLFIPPVHRSSHGAHTHTHTTTPSTLCMYTCIYMHTCVSTHCSAALVRTYTRMPDISM